MDFWLIVILAFLLVFAVAGYVNWALVINVFAAAISIVFIVFILSAMFVLSLFDKCIYIGERSLQKSVTA